MGKLKARVTDIQAIQQRLKQADKSDEIRRDELDTHLDARFNRVSDRLNGALERLMAESDKKQDKTLSKAVDGVVRAVSDTHGIFQSGMKQISQEVALSHNLLIDELAKIVIDDTLAERISKVDGLLKKLPTSFPKPEKVDIGPQLKDIEKLFADAADIGPQLKDLEERLGKRVYRFKVERDPFNDLIKEIVVTEK